MENINHRITISQKLYIWSILFEPLLFFIIIEAQNLIAIPITISRLLQLCVILIFFSKILISLKLKFVSNIFLNKFNLYIVIFILYIVLVSIFGYLSDFYKYKNMAEFWKGPVVYQGLLGTENFRPTFEIFLFIYYFIYFVVVPKYIFVTKIHLNYFFKCFFVLAFVVFSIGIVDSLSNYLYNFDLIPRHLVDNRWVHMLWRFHSICGEPRDAVVYLFFFLSIYALRNAILEKKMNKKLILLTIFCIMLTQSVSGYAGIFLGLIMILFLKASFKNILISVFLFIFFVVILITFLEMQAFYRLSNLYHEFLIFPNLIEKTGQMPEMLYLQAPDIVPLWLVWLKINSLDFFNVLFGHGFGSSTFAVNNFINYFGGLNNPRSNFSRYIFEIGLFGTLIYTLIFFKPIYEFSSIINRLFYNQFFITSVFLFAATMGHRSNLFFILIGILIAIMVNKKLIFEEGS